MWLITSFVAAIIVTALRAYAPRRYKLDYLAMMLWGLSIMVLVDHVMGYEGSGPFLEMETNGLIQSGTVLGIAMLIPVFIIWGISLRSSKTKVNITAR